jgi:hypothetical protein
VAGSSKARLEVPATGGIYSPQRRSSGTTAKLASSARRTNAQALDTRNWRGDERVHTLALLAAVAELGQQSAAQHSQQMAAIQLGQVDSLTRLLDARASRWPRRARES